MPTYLCGAGLAFLGFSVSLIIGLWVNNPFMTVVMRGLYVMVLFYILGCVLAVIGQKVVKENFQKQMEIAERSGTLAAGSPDELNNSTSTVASEQAPNSNAT